MDDILRLRQHYQNHEPRLSFGGSEGTAVTMRLHREWPTSEANEPLGSTVWRDRIKASPNTPPRVGYCVLDACLSVSGAQIPDALPLYPQMQGHELEIMVYVDHLGRILMRAIGGYSPPMTEN